MSDWREVSEQQPCPICEHTGWCSAAGDGSAVVCRRLPNHLTHGNGIKKTDKNGEEFWLYQLITPNGQDWPEPRYSVADGGGKLADPDILNKVYGSLIRVLTFGMNEKKNLLRRGLNGDQIYDFYQRGYRTLGKGRAKAARKLIEAGMEQHFPNVPGFFIQENEHGRYWSIAGRGGTLIPVRDIQGRIVALKSRSGSGTPKMTYLTSKSKKRGGPGPGSPIHIPLFDGDTSTVRVTEGELKADVATDISGILTIGLPGVGSWSRAATVLTELKAATVLVAFDADCRSNKTVAGHLRSLVFDLTEKGFSVQLETWNERDAKGIDDLLLSKKTPNVISGDDVFTAVDGFLKSAERTLQLAADSKPVQSAGDNNGQADSNGATQRDWHKPDVTLPGHDIPINYSAERLGRLLAGSGRYYRRGGAVVRLSRDDDGEPILQTMKPADLPSVFESVARLTIIKKTKDGKFNEPATCNENAAKLILHAEKFIDALPPIKVLSRCPVLVEHNSELIQVTGYDRESGVYAFGEPAPDVPLPEAVSLITEILADFNFATPSDHSRAIAALITPAMVFGQLLNGRGPVDLGEADKSQTGKGFRNKITAAAYRHGVKTIAKQKSGVGGLEETFNSALVQGANFICLDNLRGKIDSQAIESFLTEDSYFARVPYSPAIEIDPRRVIVMMTSNRAEITPDLANRSNCTRILKQRPGYQFKQFPEGDVLNHVRANQPTVLGSVFAIVREWYRQGKPQTDETRHDFRGWAQTLDWIIQKIFDGNRLMDGHEETKHRMTNPTLNWLRDVAITVQDAGRTDEYLRIHHIFDIIAHVPSVETPNANDETNLDDEQTRNKIMLAIGRRMSKCIRGESVQIDGFRIDREETLDTLSRTRNCYKFSKLSPILPNSSPIESPIETLVSPISRGESQHIEISEDGEVPNINMLVTHAGDWGNEEFDWGPDWGTIGEPIGENGKSVQIDVKHKDKSCTSTRWWRHRFGTVHCQDCQPCTDLTMLVEKSDDATAKGTIHE